MSTDQRNKLASNTNEDAVEDRDSRGRLSANTNEDVASDEECS